MNDNSEKVIAEFYGQFVENCIIRIPEIAELPEAKKVKAAKPKSVAKAKKEILKDDLTRIEGIGKKIEALLRKSDIITYKQLSKTSIKKLKEILDAAGNKFSIHDPATWPKQAKLAATGNWDELADLQKELKGGK